jgi:putative Holliday junction resolvase
MALADLASTLPVAAPLIGIDLGTRNIGIAVSDRLRTVATARSVLRRTRFQADARALIDLADGERAGGIVIGLPLNMDGSEGRRAQATRAFARNLSVLTAIPLILWDERLSTVAVERMLIDSDTSRARRAELIDKLAAAWILQGLLDRLRSLAEDGPRPAASPEK